MFGHLQESPETAVRARPRGCVCVCNPWNHRDPSDCFELLAGGARDAHWTGTNEDASAASVI